MQLHAGAGGRDGVGILLPAPSKSGKSTLTAALARERFEIVSDELVTLNVGECRVFGGRPFIHLRPDTLSLFPELAGRKLEPGTEQLVVHTVDDLGGTIVDSLVIQHLVFPQYVPGHPDSLMPIQRADALVELCKNTIAFSSQGAQALRTLAVFVRQVECWRLTFSDLDRAVALITELVDNTAVLR